MPQIAPRAFRRTAKQSATRRRKSGVARKEYAPPKNPHSSEWGFFMSNSQEFDYNSSVSELSCCKATIIAFSFANLNDSALRSHDSTCGAL